MISIPGIKHCFFSFALALNGLGGMGFMMSFPFCMDIIQGNTREHKQQRTLGSLRRLLDITTLH